MPKGIRFHKLGGPEVLEVQDVTVREPGTGEVALRVEAVGLNRAESMYYHGHYMEQPELPSGLGYEAVGVVTAVGPDGDKALIGKRFGTVPGFSMNRFPALAEEAVVPANSLAALPESLSSVEGAAVWMQYMTAYGALVYFGKVKKNDFVIITAASSSVGLAAIQIVKAEGGKAIATTRTSAKKDELLALGADYVIATNEEDLPARVQEITGGKGARIIFDPVGGPYVETLAQAAANEGILFQYGWLSLQPTPFPLFTALGKGLSVTGYTLHQISARAEVLEQAKGYIFDRLADGRFKPKVAKTFPLAQTQEAYHFLESNQQVGKVVIEVSQRS
ncbi:MAG TPA: zinc-dependent alcohol dehydrogenase family protein [Acidobacteriaceae bacterium]|nr:zinc-dependent alcohol dehydrogenase family protein [Acidobacteriaceae bacterium]